MRVYTAGPMTGIPKFNYPAFEAAAVQLRSLGHVVVSPAEMDAIEGTASVASISPDGNVEDLVKTTGITFGAMLGRDLRIIADDGIEAICLLDGWVKSRGARFETFTGLLCGCAFFSISPTGHLVERSRKEIIAAIFTTL